MDHLIGDEENIQFVGLFLDGLSPQVQKAAQEPVLYTEAMAAEDDDLLAGVSVDNEEQALGGMTPPEVRHGGGIAFQPCSSSITTAIQHGLDHRRSDAEIAGMQGREHVSSRSDQPPLAGQADH